MAEEKPLAQKVKPPEKLADPSPPPDYPSEVERKIPPVLQTIKKDPPEETPPPEPIHRTIPRVRVTMETETPVQPPSPKKEEPFVAEKSLKEKTPEPPTQESVETPPEIHQTDPIIVPPPTTITAREPELFSTFIPEANRTSAQTGNGDDRQKDFFIIGVRLLGLAFIFLFLTGLPELATLIYSTFFKAPAETAGLLETFKNVLLFPLAKMLFYLILGVYFIAGGKLLIRLLPNA
ncbi:MAG: hypothetical protein R2747_07495 [Pyrinomonadaceae bacterium]